MAKHESFDCAQDDTVVAVGVLFAFLALLPMA
jgi:hypothetical protein